MTEYIRFFRNERNVPRFNAWNGRFADLGFQLTSDIQGYAPDCLELLSCIDEVTSGLSASEEFEGNSSIFRCDAVGVTIVSLGPVPESTIYTVDEARSVVLQYFDFLAPAREDKERHVATWERENGRPYPNRAQVVF